VVLSLGAYATIGDRRIALPALWLWHAFPPIRSLRVPVRFGYLGVVCAAVLAGGALARGLDRTRRRWQRSSIGLGLVVLAVADSSIPFQTWPMPPMPPCYASVLRRRPGASFHEVHSSTSYLRYQSTLAYWQSRHGGRTSAGNPGVDHVPLAHLALAPSPFHYRLLGDPGYLSGPGPEAFDLVRDARFEDYAWLFLTAHDFDYLILHTWTWDDHPPPAALIRIRERLRGAVVFEDEATVVIDRRRLKTPTRPVLLCTDGWRRRLVRQERTSGIVARDARVAVFNPTPDRALTLRIDASSYLEPRTVRLRVPGRELARWQVHPAETATFVSPPLLLPEGLQVLTLESDGDARPIRPQYAPGGDPRPFSLWVSSVQLTREDAIARAPAAGRSGDPER
jgi:hypothetical protein